MNKILVTGSAGFIGASVCARLADHGQFEVVGVDNFNNYYDERLKRARVKYLTRGIRTFEVDVDDDERIAEVLKCVAPDVVIHLAAQAGVRYSFEKPMDYARSNLTGQVSILEAVRRSKSVKRFIYASSSSVYSGVDQLPFSEDVELGTPKSLYAATKIADEVITDTYSNLFGIDAIGLRFFTVYGPWGRPDMAYWSFAEAILSGKEIKLFNFGDVRRDFTYIDDVTGTIQAMVEEVLFTNTRKIEHRLYNVGNHSPEPVMNMIKLLEARLGVEAKVELVPLPPGDMVETYASVERLQNDYRFTPNTALDEGLSKFVDWYQNWRLGQYSEIADNTA